MCFSNYAERLEHSRKTVDDRVDPAANVLHVFFIPYLLCDGCKILSTLGVLRELANGVAYASIGDL